MIKEHPFLKNLLISDDGNVFIPKSGTNKEHWTYGSKTKNGYLQIRFNKQHYFVHRLVAETFIPNPDNKPFIDHVDRNRQNNNVSNLRWATAEDNQNNTNRNRPEGKRLKDFKSNKDYEAARGRDRYNNEPGYKEYHREYLREWRKSHSMKTP